MGMRNKIKTEFKETEIGEIPEEWNVKKIGDVCHLVRDSFSPSKEDSRAYIGLEHIEQDTLRLISIGSSKNINSNKLIFKKGQILFGKLRPYFRKVYRPNFEGVCSTDIFVIDANKKIDNCFLFYFFADRRMIEEATLSSEGTRMPRASWKYLENLQRGFPDILEQKAIAKILSDLDSKIELNNEMNKTLESIGQGLFRHWFVDFEFPNDEGKPYKSSGGEMVDSELGEMPKGWFVGPLGGIMDVASGRRPGNKSDRRDSHFCIPLIGASSVMGYVKESLCDERVLVIGRVGTHGIVQRITPPSFPSDNTLILKSKFYEYTYQMLKTINYDSLNVGTTQPLITQNSINNLRAAIPPESILKAFERSVSLLFRKVNDNNDETEILSDVRDSLLPRLMSGRIRVKVAE